jgi:gluconolactonase
MTLGDLMIRVFLPVALLVTFIATAALAQTAGLSVVRLDPALDALIAPDAKLELVRGDFGFTEGTTWVTQGRSGYLLFSDIPANVIYKMSPDGKDLSVYVERAANSGPHPWRWGFIQTNGKDKSDPKYEEFPLIGANGLALDRQGRLIIATWAGRSIVRMEKNGKRTVLADGYEGKRFGGPNDVTVKRDGAIYFTDTFGGLRLREKDPHKELDFNAVYMWKEGKVTLLIRDIPNTNGLAFSPDEKILYVNGSRDRYVKAYDVKSDGTLANGRMLIDMHDDPAKGITDGLRVDVRGNLWETGPGGIWIVTPDGRHIGTIKTPELSANVEFGDPDHKTLYIAARTGIYKIRLKIAGIPAGR